MIGNAGIAHPSWRGTRMVGLARLLLATCAVALLSGCPNPNTYGTPRTVPTGKFNHVIAAEGVSLTYGRTTSDSATLPMAPSYHLRYGLADDADLGFKVLNLDSIGADVKWNFERSEYVDFAVNPGIQGAYFSTGGQPSSDVWLFYLHLPLLIGFNIGHDLTIVATPGVTYLATETVTDPSASTQEQAIGAGSALLGRLGLGLNVRLADNFAMQPEVTAMRGFNDVKYTFVTFGLGFSLGPHPMYGPPPPE